MPFDEAVEDDGRVPSDLELAYAVTSDVACSSYYEYVHGGEGLGMKTRETS